MALDFNEATPQYLERTITLISAYPLSIVGWFRKDAATGAGYIAGIGDNGISGQQALYYSSAEDVRAYSGDSAFAETTGAGANDAWTHGAAVFTSATSRAAYRDGANSATNATSVALGTVDTYRIGETGADPGFLGEPFPGALAEVAIYNIALSATEVAMLALGVCPLMVRPEALVSYCPLIGRASAEPDLIAGGVMTHVSTPSQFAHPRMIYPPRKQLILPRRQSFIPYFGEMRGGFEALTGGLQ